MSKLAQGPQGLYVGFPKRVPLKGVKVVQSVGYEFVFNYFEFDLGVTSLSITQERSTKFTQHILPLFG